MRVNKERRRVLVTSNGLNAPGFCPRRLCWKFGIFAESLLSEGSWAKLAFPSSPEQQSPDITPPISGPIDPTSAV